MASRNSTRVLAVSLFLIAISLFSLTGYGKTIRVCKTGCSYTTLQPAIDDADPGDVIQVQNGDYAGNVVITKPVTIKGTRPTWTIISPSVTDTPLVQVNTTDGEVRLEGLGLEGNEEVDLLSAGGSGNVRLNDCRLTAGKAGIIVTNSASVKAIEVVLETSALGGLINEGGEGTFLKSEIEDNGEGFRVEDDAKLTLIESLLARNDGAGITVKNTGLANVLSSTVTDNDGSGLKVTNFSRLKLQESKVNGNETGGVLLSGSANAELVDNEILNNGSKNLSVISERCGFSGGDAGFYGVVTGSGNKIVPANSKTVCPIDLSVVNSDDGGTYSYFFSPSTLAFIGVISAATLYFILGR
ncbi:MAG: right-handed parallel beta-helix repeat-containing protein [Candidatus Acetothermia bacterium]